MLGMETLTWSAGFYEEEDGQEPGGFEKFLLKMFGEKAEKIVMGFTVAFSIIMAVGIFMVLPYFISGFFRDYIVSNTLLAVVEGAIRLGLFVLYVVLISSMKDIKECIGKILDQIGGNQIYFRSLFNENDTIIHTYDIMNICAAFEAQFDILEPQFKDKTLSDVKKENGEPPHLTSNRV